MKMRSVLLLLALSCAVLAIDSQSTSNFIDNDKLEKKVDSFARTSLDRDEVVKDGAKNKYNKVKKEDSESVEKRDETPIRDEKKTDSSTEKFDKSAKSEESFETTTKKKARKIRTTTEGNAIPDDYEQTEKTSDKRGKNKSSKSKSNEDSTDDNESPFHLTRWIFGELNSSM